MEITFSEEVTAVMDHDGVKDHDSEGFHTQLAPHPKPPTADGQPLHTTV